MIPKKISTMFSQDPDVGVKCTNGAARVGSGIEVLIGAACYCVGIEVGCVAAAEVFGPARLNAVVVAAVIPGPVR